MTSPDGEALVRSGDDQLIVRGGPGAAASATIFGAAIRAPSGRWRLDPASGARFTRSAGGTIGVQNVFGERIATVTSEAAAPSVAVGTPDDDPPHLEIQEHGAVIAVPEVPALDPVVDVVPTVPPAPGACIAGTPVVSQDGGTPLASGATDRAASPELECTHDIRQPFRDGGRLMGWSRISCPAAVGAIVKPGAASISEARRAARSRGS